MRVIVIYLKDRWIPTLRTVLVADTTSSRKLVPKIARFESWFEGLPCCKSCNLILYAMQCALSCIHDWFKIAIWVQAAENLDSWNWGYVVGIRYFCKDMHELHMHVCTPPLAAAKPQVFTPQKSSSWSSWRYITKASFLYKYNQDN